MKIQSILPLQNQDMLFEDVSTVQLLRRFMDLSYNLSGSGGSAPNFATTNAYADALIKRVPEVAYSGRMFRGIILTATEALKCKSPVDLTNYITETAKMRQQTGLSSWAKTLKGCLAYLNGYGAPGVDSVGYSDPYSVRKVASSSNLSVLVIYEQHGMGVDYEKLVQYAEDHPEIFDEDAFKDKWDASSFKSRANAMLALTSSVGEVLAGHTDTVRLGMIILEGLGKKLSKPRNEWFGNPDTHLAERYMFRPDDYKLFYHALVVQTQGEKIRALNKKVKPPHPKSQYDKEAADSLSTEARWKEAQDDNEAQYGIRQPRFSE